METLLLAARVPKRERAPKWTPGFTCYGGAFIVDPAGVARHAIVQCTESRGWYVTLAPVWVNYEWRLRYPRTFELKRLEGLYT